MAVDLAEFVLARLSEAEASWLEAASAQGPGSDVAIDRLKICRADIRRVERHRIALERPTLVGAALRELRSLALPYYDHPDFRPDWLDQRVRPWP